MLDMAKKGLKALRFEKIRVKNAKPSKSSNFHWGGKIRISKRSGLLNGEHGRQAFLYMEGVLIMGLYFFKLFSMY